jgi:hypothetical protein
VALQGDKLNSSGIGKIPCKPKEKGMFGSRRKKIQLKSVEDYLKAEDAKAFAPEPVPAPAAKSAGAKPFILQAIVILIMLALMLVAFSQLSKLRSDVTELRAGRAGDTEGLKRQVTELAARLETSDKQVRSLSDSVQALQKDLQTERSLRARTEAAAAARKASAPERKKPSKVGR